MRVCREWRRSTRPGRSDRTRPTTGRASGAPPVVASRHDEAGAIGRGAGSGGRVRPPRLGVQTGGGDPAPGRAGRRSRQAETLALDRGGGRPWHCPCGGGSRDPDASEAAGPRHQAARRDAATRPAGALGEDRRAGPGEPARPLPRLHLPRADRKRANRALRARRQQPQRPKRRRAGPPPRRRRRPAGRRCWSLRRTTRRSRP